MQHDLQYYVVHKKKKEKPARRMVRSVMRRKAPFEEIFPLRPLATGKGEGLPWSGWFLVVVKSICLVSLIILFFKSYFYFSRTSARRGKSGHVKKLVDVCKKEILPSLSHQWHFNYISSCCSYQYHFIISNLLITLLSPRYSLCSHRHYCLNNIFMYFCYWMCPSYKSSTFPVTLVNGSHLFERHFVPQREI